MRPNSDLTPADAERLLDGGSVGVPRLEHLLAAASVPVVNETGEQLAVAAFHQAGAVPVPPRPRRFSTVKSALAAAVTSKIVAGTAVAAAATGGLALAASHGGLGHGHDNQNTPGTTSATVAPSATPSPNLTGLCTAYQAGATNNPGKAGDSPAFQALVTAAGGAGNVDAYCTNLLATAPSHATGRPTDMPTQATDHPTGRPTDMPTQANGHATGRPSDMPSQATDHPTEASTDMSSGMSSGRP